MHSRYLVIAAACLVMPPYHLPRRFRAPQRALVAAGACGRRLTQASINAHVIDAGLDAAR
jgi:hypothetical protein